MKKRSLALKIARYVGAGLITLMLFVLMLFAKKPAYLIGGVRIDNIDAPDAKTKIENIIKNFQENSQIKFSYNDKLVSLKMEDIGAEWDINKTLESLRKYRNLRFTADPIATPVYVSFDREKLLEQIKKFYKDDIKKMQPSRIIMAGNTLSIANEQTGAEIEENLLTNKVEESISRLSDEIIPIYFRFTPPPITSSDLSIYFEELKTILHKQITLKYGWSKYTFYPLTYLDSIYYQKEYAVQGGATSAAKILIKLNKEKTIKDFISKITDAVDTPSAPVKIYKNEKGKIIFEGEGNTGEEVQIDDLITLMEDAMNNNQDTIKIPVTETPPRVIASEELQALGIKELLGVGHTSYYGSPANRIYNIGVGVAHFNGAIIQPNEEFSFNKYLGRVDETTGYLKELTIKPEGTIPEYGGGLCQVSTTIYRAIINSGLPVIERSPHSYAVKYYSQIGGHGLDATVYPGSHDLKFKNDTPAAILIQSYTIGLEAFYKFYGTSDGRKVELDGPYLSDSIPAGEKQIIKTLALPAGQQKQVERAGPGFKALWYRIITSSDGTIQKEKITSAYRATSDKILVGIDPNSEESLALQQTSQPQTQAEKQFTD